MPDGITIIGREWVTDPKAPQLRKEVVTYSVRTAALIDTILDEYENTGEGSYAICFAEGIFKNLIDGVWE